MKHQKSKYSIQKKMLVTFYFVFLIVFSSSGQTITFDDQGHSDFAFLPNPYTIGNGSESFRFTFSNGGAALPGNHRYRTTDTDGCNVSGAPFGYLRVDLNATTWIIETVSGNEINLGNIRFLNMLNCYSSFVYSITVTGFKNGTSTGSQAFSVTGGNSVFNPNTSFDDVDTVVITCANLASLGIDDINWTPSTLSIQENVLQDKIKIITTKEIIKIQFPQDLKLQNYTIYNITGTKISEGNSSEISTSPFSNGIYIIRLEIDDQIIIKKILINN
jgi:hypothetical protein